jgi:hypothetical protein
MSFSETTYFIAADTHPGREERLSIALCMHPDGYCEAKLTVDDVEKKTKSKFRPPLDVEAQRSTLQQKTVRHSTLVKIADYAPDIWRFLSRVLQDFDTGRWTPRAGGFRYKPLGGPGSWGWKSRPLSKGGLVHEIFYADYYCGIGVVATPDYENRHDLDDLAPVIFIGNFQAGDCGREMTDGIRISPKLACRMFRDGGLHTIMKKFEKRTLPE